MSGIGYTERQAAIAHRRIERAVARVEDALTALERAVPDTTVSTAWLAEEVREVGRSLDKTVDRRRRR